MNLPNKITVLRVLLIPVFLFLYMAEPFGMFNSQIMAFVIFVAASASDALDGYIARSRGLVTNFGKLMDPLADKLLVCAALVAMTARGVLPAWAVIVIISREFFITGFRQLALEQSIVLAASFWGKLKTITQMLMILFVLAPLPVETIPVLGVAKWILIAAAVVLSVLSAVEYVIKNKKVMGSL